MPYITVLRLRSDGILTNVLGHFPCGFIKRRTFNGTNSPACTVGCTDIQLRLNRSNAFLPKAATANVLGLIMSEQLLQQSNAQNTSSKVFEEVISNIKRGKYNCCRLPSSWGSLLNGAVLIFDWMARLASVNSSLKVTFRWNFLT